MNNFRSPQTPIPAFSAPAKKKITVIMPVFNDWESCAALVKNVDDCTPADSCELSILVVNDGSPYEIMNREKTFQGLQNLKAVEILHLARNLGHQRAIAVALAFTERNRKADAVVVMDADGEDRPEDIWRLVAMSDREQANIIFARRSKRSEGILFRCSYRVFKTLYRLLTGTSISFGNFCLIPSSLMAKLVFVSEIWNHFSAGVIRSRLPFQTIPAFRGSRIAGRSTMRWSGLVFHGLSALAVHMEVVAVRLLVTALGLIVTSAAALGVVFAIRFWTDWAVPGWATYVSVGLGILFVQGFLISLVLVFMILTARTQKLFVPALDYGGYILKQEKVFPGPCARENILERSWNYSARPETGSPISTRS